MVNIVQQTNLYAKQVTGDIKYESRTEITVEELKAYFASNGDGTFSINGGLLEEGLVLCYLPISDCTFHDCFRHISRYIYFVNNFTVILEDKQVMIVWVKYANN